MPLSGFPESGLRLSEKAGAAGLQTVDKALSTVRPLKNPTGRLGGPKPSKYNPNPATCAAGSEALRSKVSLRVSPAAPQAQGKRVLAKKAGVAGLQTADKGAVFERKQPLNA